MDSARPLLLLASLVTLAAATGCGTASGGKAAPAAAAPEAPAEQTPADYSDEGASEESAAEQPSSLVRVSDGEETERLDSLEDADALLGSSRQLLDGLFGKEKKRQRAADGPSALTADADDCATACKAFASLRRAADAICRIAGEETARCGKAREVVAMAEEQIAACACSIE